MAAMAAALLGPTPLSSVTGIRRSAGSVRANYSIENRYGYSGCPP